MTSVLSCKSHWQGPSHSTRTSYLAQLSNTASSPILCRSSFRYDHKTIILSSAGKVGGVVVQNKERSHPSLTFISQPPCLSDWQLSSDHTIKSDRPTDSRSLQTQSWAKQMRLTSTRVSFETSRRGQVTLARCVLRAFTLSWASIFLTSFAQTATTCFLFQ